MDKPMALNRTEGTRGPQVENAKMYFIRFRISQQKIKIGYPPEISHFAPPSRPEYQMAITHFAQEFWPEYPKPFRISQPDSQN